MEDFKLHKLPSCGRLFVAFFCIMVMAVMIWMALVGMMESGMLGNVPSTITQEGFSWSHFNANMQWSLSHLSAQALLYMVLGLLFVFTTYACKLRRMLAIVLGILIGLHVLGIAGYGFCWAANLLTYIPGALILVLFFTMALMTLLNLKEKK